jgi:hypothetical protein
LPVFGDKDAKEEKQQKSQAAYAEVERLEALPPIQLASEVMTRGFGPGGPADTVAPLARGTSIRKLLQMFEPDGGSDSSLHDRLYDIVADSVQVLEHASLLRPDGTVGSQQGLAFYSATRWGRAALERNAVERVLHGESL